MKNQSGTIKTNLELYRVVKGGSGGYRRLPGGSAHFSLQTNRQTLHHNIYISSRWGHIVWVSQACPTIPFPWENSQILDGRKVVEEEVTSTLKSISSSYTARTISLLSKACWDKRCWRELCFCCWAVIQKIPFSIKGGGPCLPLSFLTQNQEFFICFRLFRIFAAEYVLWLFRSL